MCSVKLLVALTMLTLVTTGSHSRGGLKRRRDSVANNRRHRHHRYYAAPPPPPQPQPQPHVASEDYDEVEVNSYCRESVAHHENYVRTLTQPSNSSTKVVSYLLLSSLVIVQE